jgi:hypothetical protein
MSALTRDEIRALVEKADELIKQAQELQARLHQAMAAERRHADQSTERRRTERRKTPRKSGS